MILLHSNILTIHGQVIKLTFLKKSSCLTIQPTTFARFLFLQV